MDENLTMLDVYLIPWLIKIAMALAIFVVGKLADSYLSAFVAKLMVRSRLDEMLIKFLHNLLYVVLLIAVALAAVQKLGVNVTSLLTIIGAAGLAVGLALKDSLSNFAAGVMIITFRPFRIGDAITANGNTGVVDEIGMFCTLMHTFDNQRVIIPNSAVIGGTIINSSAFLTRRIDLTFQIAYTSNIGDAKKAMENVISADARILKDPATAIGVDQLGSTTITLYLRAWVRSSDYGDARTDILEKIKSAMDKADISFLPPPVLVATRPPPATEESV